MVESAMTDRFKYTQIYTVLLQLEEAAEVLSLQKYNLSYMKLSFTERFLSFDAELLNN